jgi:5'-nucleotidase
MSSAQNETIVIVYSHNTNGVLENCHCPERSYGALEKRSALIDSIRKSEKNVLLLDTGDILDIQKSPILHKYIVGAYDYIHYDYWTPGDQDFVEGTEFFLNKLGKISAQIVSSNIRYKDDLIGQSFVIKKYGNILIGITGTIRDDLHKFLEPPTNMDFKFEDQFLSLGLVIKEMSDKTDFIILLSHSGIDRDRKISEKFPSVDLIIGGHSQTVLNQPEKSGLTYITQVGESGYRIGILKFVFKNKKIISADQSVVLLTKNMASNSTVEQMIEEYHRERLAK